MVCPSCGGKFNGFLKRCPCCGAQTFFESEHSSKLGTWLSKPAQLGSLTLRNFDLILVVVLNIIVLAFVIGGIMHGTYGTSMVWCYYISGVVLAVYTSLKGTLSSKQLVLKYIRNAVYVVVCFLGMVGLSCPNQINGVLVINAVLLFALGSVCIVFLLMGRASHMLFGTSSLMNTLITALGLIIIHRTTEELSFLAVIFSYLAFGISAVCIGNYLLLWAISLLSRFKNSF